MAHRAEHQLPKLVNIGSCSLHIIHSAFKTGAESTNWAIKSTFKGAFHFLHDTPARRNDYISVTGSSKFPLFFCGTRWVEDKAVADRLVDIWENIVNLVRYFEKFSKSKQPTSKSFVNVQKACNDVFQLPNFNCQISKFIFTIAFDINSTVVLPFIKDIRKSYTVIQLSFTVFIYQITLMVASMHLLLTFHQVICFDIFLLLLLCTNQIQFF